MSTPFGSIFSRGRNQTVKAPVELVEVIEDANDAGLGPLPSGWEMRYAKVRRPYFVDHTNKR